MNSQLFMFSRVSAHYLLALVCLLLPEVGENRFLLAGILALVIAPVAFALSFRFSRNTYLAHDLYLDVLTAVLFGFLTSENWYVVLLIGVVVVMAPSISLQKRSLRTYATGYGMLLAGMTAAAAFNDVERWHLPIIALGTLALPVLLYAHWQMQVSDELRLAARSQQRMRLVAGGIAHDYNNALTGMHGNIELALLNVRETDDAFMPLREAIKASDRVTYLTSQLLAFSGRNLQEKTSLDLGKEVGSMVKLAQSIAPTEVVIEFVTEPGIPVINAQRSLLQQVFLNVILNAVEATSAPGKVYVSVESTPSFIEVRVKDAGRHTDSEETSLLSAQSAAQLGFSAVQNILDEHRGDIQIVRNETQGTEVLIAIPVVPPSCP